MIKLIGFHGYAGSGKDTAALALTADGIYSSYAFAKPMKDACKIIFNWTEEHVNGHLKEVVDPVFGVSPRKALQTIGTEWGRDTINENIWLLRAQAAIDQESLLVITDVRFDNEAELIRSNGGIVLNIVRPSKPNTAAGHTSEGGISKHLIDGTIHNTGTIARLHNIVNGYNVF